MLCLKMALGGQQLPMENLGGRREGDSLILIDNVSVNGWTAANTIKHKIDYWLRIPEIPSAI